MNNIELIPIEKKLLNMTFKESFISLEILESLIKRATFEGNEWNINLLNKIKTIAIKNNNSLTIKYDNKKSKFGRIYPLNGFSLGQVERRYRHTLCDSWADLDFENAQPTLLLELLEKNDSIFSYDNLKEYIENREDKLNEVIETYSVSRDKAKQLFIRVINNGSVEKWKQENKVVYEGDLPFIMNLKKEMRAICKILMAHNKKLVSIVEKKQNEKDFENVEGSFMSMYCGELEYRALECAVLKCKEMGLLGSLNETMLCHDGFTLHCSNIEKYIGSNKLDESNQEKGIELLNELNSHINKTLETKRLLIRFKPMTEGYSEEELKEADCCKSDYERIKEQLEADNGLFYLSNQCLYYYKAKNKDGSYVYKECKNEKELKKQFGLDIYRIEDINKKGEKSEIDFIDKWVKDSRRQTFSKFVYKISQQVEQDEINLWEGFDILKVDACDDEQTIKADLERVNHWLDCVTSEDVELKNYICLWIADIIQNKDVKNTHAVPLLISEEMGSGKSSLGDFVAGLLGDSKKQKYVIARPGMDGITKNFNSCLKDCFLYVAEELKTNNGIESLATFKYFTTSTSFPIEQKGKDSFEINNKVRMIITSNDLAPIPVSNTERRLLPSKVSNKLVGNKDFWNSFYEMIEDTSRMRFLYNYFNNPERFDTSKLRKLPLPESEYCKQLKELNKKPFIMFIDDSYDWLKSHIEEPLTSEAVLSAFEKWCIKNKLENKMNSKSLGLALASSDIKNLFEKKKTKVCNKYLINKEALEEYFKCFLDE